MAQIELWFVGRDKHDALARGPITASDVAQMIAGPENLNIYKTRTTIKSWQIAQIDDQFVMRVVRADFNEVDEQNCILVRGDRVGDSVGMLDGDGNFCKGKIVAVGDRSGYLAVELDYSTWSPAEPS